jgi:hypothetical protein
MDEADVLEDEPGTARSVGHVTADPEAMQGRKRKADARPDRKDPERRRRRARRGYAETLRAQATDPGARAREKLDRAAEQVRTRAKLDGQSGK